MKRTLFGVALALACSAGAGGCAVFGGGDNDVGRYQGGVGLPKPLMLPTEAPAAGLGKPKEAPAPAPFDPGKLGAIVRPGGCRALVAAPEGGRLRAKGPRARSSGDRASVS